MATIHLEEVVRRYEGSADAVSSLLSRSEERQAEGTAALNGVTLTIPDGTTCAVIGPSGCGKSTLLRVIAGLDMEYTGAVTYDGKDMREVPPGQRNIGMVFQNYALYPHFQGVNNLRFSFWVRKAPDAEAEERIRITSEIMGYGFEQLLAHKPGTLSGGQQQRLAIARALVRSPELFLFDEPLSNLDAQLRTQTRIEIKRLLNRFAITALYVTHDQEEAMALGDQIAVIRAGRVEQVGSYAELRRAPTNTYVAGFLGRYPMNLLEGTVTGDGSLRVAGLQIPLPSTRSPRRGQSVTAGIWPEDLTLNTAPGTALHLNGIVEDLEIDYSRRTQYVRVQTEAGMIIVADTSNLRLAEDDHISVVLSADQLIFFDGESGGRIETERLGD
jgi:ABC-type sugar transport system ATPase subunit